MLGRPEKDKYFHILEKFGNVQLNLLKRVQYKWTDKNVVFWDVTQCGSSKNRRFRGKYHIHHQCNNNRLSRDNVISNTN
jgi:hypothetical protein